MNLEIKHLSPYLPYSLKVIMEGKKTNVAWMSTKNIAIIRPRSIGDLKKIKWEYAPLNIRPILRPLTVDEIKQIWDEHSEKDELIKDYLSEEFIRQREFCDLDELLLYHIDTWPVGTFNVLLKYHFDVFGLIEKGLAIDINSIDNVS